MLLFTRECDFLMHPAKASHRVPTLLLHQSLQLHEFHVPAVVYIDCIIFNLFRVLDLILLRHVWFEGHFLFSESFHIQ